MHLLLDTHLLLWTVYEPSALSNTAFELLNSPSTEVFFSSASLWEIAIKNTKYTGTFPPVADVRQDFDKSGFTEVAISGKVMPYLERMPLLHKDPFDRLLIATAYIESMLLLTRDDLFKQYDPASSFIVLC